MGCIGRRKGEKDQGATGKADHLRKKKEKEKSRMLRKSVRIQDEWRMQGRNKTDYMFLDFSK